LSHYQIVSFYTPEKQSNIGDKLILRGFFRKIDTPYLINKLKCY